MVLVREMPTRYHLFWWQWGKLSGFILPILLFVNEVEHHLLWALAAHLFVDFTAQSIHTVIGKSRRDWTVLAYHAFIAGGYAGLIAGGWLGLAVSVVIHFLVDMTDKFGLDEPWGPILDQTVHILTLLFIWVLI